MPGWVDGLGYKLLISCAKALDITNILVIGDDRLTSALKQDFSTNKNITIERLTKSGGVRITFIKILILLRL